MRESENEQLKSDHVAKLSHDIRTSMNVILGMTMVAETNLSNQARVSDCLQKINAAGRHMLVMINEVFDMSKMEAGTLELTEEELSIRGIVDNVMEIMKPRIDEKKQKITISDEKLVHDRIIGDSQHLLQIFINILENANRYTQRGGKLWLTISEKKDSASQHGCFEFVFKDNGPGITEEATEQQGFGLYIAEYMAKLMNGGIQVESEEGKGTEITVTLHLKLQEDKDSVLGDFADVREYAGKRILIAEDNEINAEIAKEIFETIGLTADIAKNGKEAVKMLKGSKPEQYSMVFMDIQMPVMDGYEAARKIRSLKREDLKQIPIIAMSADAFAEHVRAAEEAGMNRHIAKPLNVKQIAEVLQKWM